MIDDDAALFRLSARVGRWLIARRWTLATVESCTGGWVGKVLTDVPGSSAWFGDGFVTYSDESKRRLGVPGGLLARHGAVSEPVVRAMVRAALERTGADLATAVSGIAGPCGAVPGKPVGTVWICWGMRRTGRAWLVARRYRFRGDREVVRRKSVAAALRGLLVR